ncbi:terminase small subunit [Phaeobacter inhibens]|uniref:terminase small subunit n=1 Tax=Phaeobacter inhibens TaxID=221822 RepID=UPI0035CCF232
MPSCKKLLPLRPPWRPRKIKDPEQLAVHFVRYAHWIEDNPLLAEKVLFSQNESAVSVKVRKPRPMTIESFSAFLGISPRTWRYWRANREDLAEKIIMIEDAIYDQLFCLAAANMLNANLINRKLRSSHHRKPSEGGTKV